MGFQSFEAKGGNVHRERVTKFQYEAAHKNIESKKINVDDFADIYSAESIQDDKDYVKKHKQIFKISDAKVKEEGQTDGTITQIGECAENIIISGVESGWIPHTTAIKTADFDDIHDGVDVILERQKDHGPSTHLALGVDVTCAKSMDDKFHKIRKMLDSGSLATIKYFKSGNFKGQLSNVPKVIAAIDVYAVERLEKEKSHGADLSKHTIRLILLKQFELQLDTFIAYVNTVNPSVVPHLSIARESVRAMTKDLEPEMTKYSHLFAEHPTLIAMKEKLIEFFPTRSAKPTTGRILKG